MCSSEHIRRVLFNLKLKANRLVENIYARSVKLYWATSKNPARYFAHRRAEELFHAFKVLAHCAQCSLIEEDRGL
jgi:hypothetical protein